MNRPLYLGVTILELSKFIMYSYFYKVLKPKYGDRLRFLYIDTDSYVISLQDENYLEKVKESFCNNSTLFKVKDELKHTHFLGLSSLRYKTYSCLLGVDKEISSKNVGKGVLKEMLNAMYFHAYYMSLVSRRSFSDQFSKISTKNYILSLKEEVKSCFNSSDDKHNNHECLVHSRPIGH